ncbi:MAG: polymer-forming cytoskeletal protein, partial [Rhodospirillales bacterium]|nr:polymer-forming cytoskeletal protein [Rhodospirillales bacterium]
SSIEGRKLVVGREICLNGEITSCDTLVVEGEVEATLTDARLIDVAETGLFKGSATVDEAEINGRFDGDLTARDLLTVRAGGRVSGTIRYGRIVIESGGEITGDTQALSTADNTSGADSKAS